MTKQDWTYYSYGLGLPGEPPVLYFRRRNGVSQGLRVIEPLAWIPTDDSYLSRYIERGEAGLSEVKRADIESALGRPIPTEEAAS